MDVDAAQPNGFVLLGAELRRRLLTPVRHVTFWVYLVLGVVFFAALPIWLELYLYFSSSGATLSDVRLALIAFFPALIGSVSIQLIFEEAGRSKRMLAFALFVGFMSFLVCWCLIVLKSISNCAAVPIATAASLSAVFMWWIANGTNRTFTDEFDFEAPVGGPSSAPPAGDLSGFKV